MRLNFAVKTTAFLDSRTCRRVLSISVASSCLPCLAMSIMSWIMPTRRWYGGGGPARESLSPARSTSEARTSLLRSRVGVLLQRALWGLAPASSGLFACFAPMTEPGQRHSQIYSLASRTKDKLAQHLRNDSKRELGRITQVYSRVTGLFTSHLSREECGRLSKQRELKLCVRCASSDFSDRQHARDRNNAYPIIRVHHKLQQFIPFRLLISPQHISKQHDVHVQLVLKRSSAPVP